VLGTIGVVVALAAGPSAAVTLPVGEVEGAVSGSVTTSDGGPAPEVIVDLFDTTSTGDRAEFVTSTTTDGSGRFELELGAAGCYLVGFVAPAGATFAGGSRSEQARFCLEEGETITELGAVVASVDESQIRGHITFGNGAGASGAHVDLYAAAGDGTRGPYLRSAATDSGGWYSFDVSPACYVVLITAPEGEVFASGEATQRQNSCIAEGKAVALVDGVLGGTAHLPAPLSPVEAEMVRLTNELRADPSGPLARRSPMPPCVDETFYAITIDPATGHPPPSPALAVDDQVSVAMARAWAVEMQQRADFSHRPGPSQEEVYSQLGVGVAAWGENIAWLAGFGPEDAARIHFEGWRESDIGHYCTMMSARFTHVGVGEHRVGDESWAVQNYYQPR
jgi:hypothetical protein